MANVLIRREERESSVEIEAEISNVRQENWGHQKLGVGVGRERIPPTHSFRREC